MAGKHSIDSDKSPKYPPSTVSVQKIINTTDESTSGSASGDLAAVQWQVRPALRWRGIVPTIKLSLQPNCSEHSCQEQSFKGTCNTCNGNWPKAELSNGSTRKAWSGKWRDDEPTGEHGPRQDAAQPEEVGYCRRPNHDYHCDTNAYEKRRARWTLEHRL